MHRQFLIVFILGMFFSQMGLAQSTPTLCKDFDSAQSQLPVCGYKDMQQAEDSLQKTLTRETIHMEEIKDNDTLPDVEVARAGWVWLNLGYLELYTIPTFKKICRMKGDFAHGEDLTAGCMHNAARKTEALILQAVKSTYQPGTDGQWYNFAEQEKFSHFFDETLLAISQSNLKKSGDGYKEKSLMSSMLDIYSMDGSVLQFAFVGFCSLQGIADASANTVVNEADVLSCEKNFLNQFQSTITKITQQF